MATITPTRYPGADVKHQRVSWEGFAASGDVGTAVGLEPYPDRTVQALGSFTGSLGITWQGSLDGGATWFTLTNVNGGTSLVQTAAGGAAVTEAVPLIRPLATAGSGGADVDVWLYATGVEV